MHDAGRPRNDRDAEPVCSAAERAGIDRRFVAGLLGCRVPDRRGDVGTRELRVDVLVEAVVDDAQHRLFVARDRGIERPAANDDVTRARQLDARTVDALRRALDAGAPIVVSPVRQIVGDRQVFGERDRRRARHVGELPGDENGDHHEQGEQRDRHRAQLGGARCLLHGAIATVRVAGKRS